MAYSLITIQHNESQADMETLVLGQQGDRVTGGKKLMNYLRALLGGARSAMLVVKVNAVKASGTVTLSSHVATNTVTINGVVLTADTDYAVGGDDTATAANLATAINANTTLDGMVYATSSGAVVTVEALTPGELGNAVTLAISANGSVSAARLAGGTNGAASRTHYYGSAS